MSNNVVYGKLNRRIIPLKYTGVDTETANTTVDNENQTISVDVIGIDGVVKYNEPQDLTNEEKEQAKSNIGVVEYTGGTTETAEVHIEDGTITVDVSNVYSAGENIQISEEGVISATDTTYSIATDATAGLVKSSTTGSTPNKDYNVEVNVDGTMKVNVPWTDTTYSSLSPVQGGADLSLVTTGEKYTWNGKQDALVSGTNIKTINNASVLGNGNIEVQSVIDSSHKLSADLVDDTSTTNKFVTAADKTAWDGKSVVSVSDSGTAVDEVRYITINGAEKKLAGGTDVMYVDWS